MTDHPTRAPWWREVTDPTEVVEAGCPLRYEVVEAAYESRAGQRLDRLPSSASKVFIDSRWAPSKPVYKVGDVITECTYANLPADGVGLVDAEGDIGQMDGRRIGWACGGGVTWGSAVGERCFPLTVVYVPEDDA